METVTELTGYVVAAAELRRIADAIEHLPGAVSHVAVDMHPGPRGGTAEQITAAVDAAAMAVFGKPAETKLMGSGVRHHTISDWKTTGSAELRETFGISIYNALPDTKDAEIARLKAELEQAQTTIRAAVGPS